MKTSINDFIQFISSYREMETSTKSVNKKLIKSIVPQRKFDHLYNSWSGRENDFGSYFLNLEYKIQGLFLKTWGIEIPLFDEFLTELGDSPQAYFTAIPPIEILEIRALVLFFNNHSIEKNSLPCFSFAKSPVNKYGNSANWGTYLLSLSDLERTDFFNCFEDVAVSEIKTGIATINFFKKSFEEKKLSKK